MERTFGQLQARFRSLYHRSLEVKFGKAVQVITVACILHNICTEAGDFVDYRIPIRRQQAIERNEVGGEAHRNVICLAHIVGRNQAMLERQI